jgi:hypothetical protein
MYQAINNVFRKAETANRGRSSLLRGRRKDDVVVAGIAVLLGVLFFVQLAWVIAYRTHH